MTAPLRPGDLKRLGPYVKEYLGAYWLFQVFTKKQCEKLGTMDPPCAYIQYWKNGGWTKSKKVADRYEAERIINKECGFAGQPEAPLPDLKQELIKAPAKGGKTRRLIDRANEEHGKGRKVIFHTYEDSIAGLRRRGLHEDIPIERTQARIHGERIVVDDELEVVTVQVRQPGRTQ